MGGATARTWYWWCARRWNIEAVGSRDIPKLRSDLAHHLYTSTACGCQQVKLHQTAPARFRQDGPMFSDEALCRILTEADRIVQDAQELLNRATATGQAELIEAANTNLRQ